MKILPVNIYSFYKNTPFRAQKSAEVSPSANTDATTDIKKYLEYLLPQDKLSKSQAGARQFGEFENKTLPYLVTAEGETFVMETTHGPTGNKISGTIYKLGRDAAIKMIVSYGENSELAKMEVHQCDNSVHILNFKDKKEPTWDMPVNGENVRWGLSVDYMDYMAELYK